MGARFQVSYYDAKRSLGVLQTKLRTMTAVICFTECFRGWDGIYKEKKYRNSRRQCGRREVLKPDHACSLPRCLRHRGVFPIPAAPISHFSSSLPTTLSGGLHAPVVAQCCFEQRFSAPSHLDLSSSHRPDQCKFIEKSLGLCSAVGGDSGHSSVNVTMPLDLPDDSYFRCQRIPLFKPVPHC